MQLHSSKKMARKKIRKITTRAGGIRFNIEADAQQMLQDAIDSMPLQIDKSDDTVETSIKKPVSRAKTAAHQIDLHGLTLRESQQQIDALLRRIVSKTSNVRVKIITGKGRHRQCGEHLLARDVHSWLQHKYQAWIVEIEQSPHDVRIGDLPLRGHFEVVLRRSD